MVQLYKLVKGDSSSADSSSEPKPDEEGTDANTNDNNEEGSDDSPSPPKEGDAEDESPEEGGEEGEEKEEESGEKKRDFENFIRIIKAGGKEEKRELIDGSDFPNDIVHDYTAGDAGKDFKNGKKALGLGKLWYIALEIIKGGRLPLEYTDEEKDRATKIQKGLLKQLGLDEDGKGSGQVTFQPDEYKVTKSKGMFGKGSLYKYLKERAADEDSMGYIDFSPKRMKLLILSNDKKGYKALTAGQAGGRKHKKTIKKKRKNGKRTRKHKKRKLHKQKGKHKKTVKNKRKKRGKPTKRRK